MGLGFTEVILIFLVVLLFFGAKRLPEIARSLGKATSEFHKAKNEILSPPAPAGLETQIADAEAGKSIKIFENFSKNENF